MRRRTALFALVAVLATAVPAPGATAAVNLSTGSTGPEVARLQSALAAKGFYRETVDGVFGTKTAQAVMAFRKEIGATRAFIWSGAHWDDLNGYRAPYARHTEPDRMEVNLTRQVAYLFRGGTLQGVFPIASGNGETYLNSYGRPIQAYTPTGSFKFYLHRNPPATGGWHTSYLGDLYKPWYFTGGYAIHGSRSVPSEPASHGCVRFTIWDADWLHSHLRIGMPIHIWFEPPGVGPTIGAEATAGPGDGPFWDVPKANPFSADIAWLRDSGVTVGCSKDGRYFCPTDQVTRGQIAAFLRRQLQLPYTALDFFWDDSHSPFEYEINALAVAGVAVACNPPANDAYCPDALLRRDEFAGFLRRALDLPPTWVDYFADDIDSPFHEDINALAAAGITRGCATGYCPDGHLTREEMAALLHRASQYRP